MFNDKLPIELQLINGVSGDPAIYGFFPRTGDGILFDLGSIDNLPNKDLLRVRHILITHTHIDHFIGFDRLLRVNIPHGRTIEVFGPPGIIDNVKGKLQGYHWNLLVPGQVSFVVYEFSTHSTLKCAKLINDNNFIPVFENKSKLDHFPDETILDTVILDHSTPVMGYILRFPTRFQVVTDELNRLKLSPGPWIRELQIAAHNGDDDRMIQVEGKSFKVTDLKKTILKSVPPTHLIYITDFSFSLKNLQTLKSKLPKHGYLMCESCFKEADFIKAKEKDHLTTKQAALVAAYSEAASISTFHFSNIYTNSFQDLTDEVQSFYQKFKVLDQKELENQINIEINRS